MVTLILILFSTLPVSAFVQDAEKTPIKTEILCDVTDVEKKCDTPMDEKECVSMAYDLLLSLHSRLIPDDPSGYIPLRSVERDEKPPRISSL